MDENVTRLEHGARQPRFAIEADGHANTKTQERTEGATTAVQAMRGDSWTTEQKVQDGPKTSITFDVETEPPDLPCGDDVLVEGAMPHPSRVSHSWRCAHQQPPVAYFPPAKPLQLRGPLSTSHFFSFTRPRR